MRSHHGDGDYWSMTFIAKGFEFTEKDLTAVRCAVELPSGGGGRGSSYRLLPLDQYDRPGGGPSGLYHGGWDRTDGRHRTNRIVVSCTKGQRPGPTVMAYEVLQQRYPDARFTMDEPSLREQLNKRNLSIVAP